MSATLLCPKCVTPMRVIERSGITLERCPECGGIFLDRGELERMSEQETAYVAREVEGRVERDRARTAAAPAESRPYRYDDDDDDDDDDRRKYSQQVTYDRNGKPIKKKRKNFLEDLFDFG